MSHKAGFVNIIGNPNVGKSTLMNAFVGERLSIITSKAQTTRQDVYKRQVTLPVNVPVVLVIEL